MMKDFRFVDLFCGIGGFHQAMTSLGGKCVFACDIDNDCRKTYHANYGIMPAGNIKEIDAADIPPHDVLCAGFPCQSFSKAGNRLGFSDAAKGTLFFDIIRILKHHKPGYALLENVRNLASHDHGNTWRVIHDLLEDSGYNLLPRPIIFSPHCIGIPQHRERVYIICVRKDLGCVPEFHFDKRNMPECNVNSILQDDSEIPDIGRYKLSDGQVQLLRLWDEFISGIKCRRLPGFPVWTEWLCEPDNGEDMTQYPKWKQNFIRKNNELYLDNKAFIDAWLAKAHGCPLFFGAKAKLEWQAGQVENPTLFDNILQMRPSGIRVKPSTYFPALVAITQTSIIGSRLRFLTPRECARLQSFPDTFQPDVTEAQAYKQLGNSVNVECVRLFAKFMLGDEETRGKYGAGGFLNYALPTLL